MLEEAALEELPQHPLDHRSKSTSVPGEAHGPHPQQLLQVALDELVKRRLARLPRPVDPAGDLHAQPRAGGRVAGRIGRRTARLSRGQGSPSTVPAGVRIVREPGPRRRTGSAFVTANRPAMYERRLFGSGSST